ncbi:hypothetical protein Tco_0763423, partial [Tanacetum coccineum]
SIGKSEESVRTAATAGLTEDILKILSLREVPSLDMHQMAKILFLSSPIQSYSVYSKSAGKLEPLVFGSKIRHFVVNAGGGKGGCRGRRTSVAA